MTMKKLLKIFSPCVLALVIPLEMAGQITVTVNPTPKQTFKGAGFNVTNFNEWNAFFNASEGDKRNFMKRLVTEGKFEIARPWPMSNTKQLYFDSKLIPYMVDAGMDNVAIFGGLNDDDGVPNPCTNAQGRAVYYANQIAELKAAGYKVTHFDIRNKSNSHQFGNCRMEPQDVINAIKAARVEFDKKGLQSVQIIGPGTIEFWPRDHIDANHLQSYTVPRGDDSLYFATIGADPAAVSAMGAFSFQDYGKGATTFMESVVKKSGKDFWCSLAATDDAPGDNSNWMLAAISSAQYLSDVNHGVTHFTHWSMGQLVRNDNPANPQFHSRYHAFKSLNSTFDVGAVFRGSTSSPAAPTSDMHWEYYKEPDIISATARNPDGSFGIGVVNLTGLDAEHRWLNYYANNSKTISLTINVPELANTPSVTFRLWKMKSGDGSISDAGNVTMTNGKLTMQVGSMEIYSLRSGPVTINEPVADITLTGKSGAKQTFFGFGTTFFADHVGIFNSMSSAKQTEMLGLMKPLNIKFIKLWGTNQDKSFFNRLGADTISFIYSGLGGAGDASSSVGDGIQNLKNNGFNVTHTLIKNELNMPPGSANDEISPSGVVQRIKEIRANLNGRGLSGIKIVGPETVENSRNAANSSADDDIRYLNTMKADATAWSQLDAFCTHSYGHGAKKVVTDQIGTKEYWQTEHCLSSPENNTSEQDRGVVTAGTFIGDLNNMVTHWQYFMAFGGGGVTGGGDPYAKMVVFDKDRTGADWVKPLPMYYAVKQIVNAFTPGTVVRSVNSSKDANMEWEYNYEPDISATIGRRKDGRWAVAMVNMTGFTSNWGANGIFIVNDAATAKTLKSKIVIEELAATASMNFRVFANTPTGDYTEKTAITFINGVAYVDIKPRELLTFVSDASVIVVPVAVTGVSLQPATVAVGETKTLSPSISPANATNKAVTYKSSNTAIATVSNTGEVTGVAVGTATITVTTDDGSKTASSLITVVLSTLYEAEGGTFGVDARIQDATNASAGKLVGNMNTVGTFSQVSNVNGGTGGTATLVIRYANGFGANSIVSLYVNGVDVGQLTFVPTGNWNTFGEVTKTITLVSGTSNTVKLQKDANDVSAADIDRYSVTPTIVTSFGDETDAVSELSIYPNPSRSQFTVSLPNQSFELQLFNADGTSLLKQTVNGSFTNESIFSAGVYFVKISTINGTTQVRKLVIQ